MLCVKINTLYYYDYSNIVLKTANNVTWPYKIILYCCQPAIRQKSIILLIFNFEKLLLILLPILGPEKNIEKIYHNSNYLFK